MFLYCNFIVYYCTMGKHYRFISFLSDFGFKITFGDEGDTLFLRTALGALLQHEVPIAEIAFLNNEFSGLTKDARGGSNDLVCVDESGNTFIVEMQLQKYDNFIHRLKFYAFQRLNTFVKRGDYEFDDLKPIYCIGFMAHDIFPDSKEYYHIGTLQNQHGEEMDRQITHIIVEISKFDKKESEIHTNLDKLIYVMKNLEAFNNGFLEIPEFITEEWLQRAIKNLKAAQMDSEQMMHYEMMLAREAARVRSQRMEKEEAVAEAVKIVEKAKEAAVAEAEEKVRKAKEEAFAEVVEKVKKAKEEALLKASQAEKRVQETFARKLKAIGMPDTKIAELSDLSLEEVKKLK